MRKEGDREKILNRRALLLGGGQLVMFGVLAARMYYLQVIESDQYKMLADENRINLRLLPPPRGRIIDRFGTELANNERNYRVVLIPEQTDDVEMTLARLSDLIPISSRERRRILRDTKRMRSFVPISVTENLTWEQFSRINVASPDLPGIQPDVGEKRFYPHGEAFAHVVGYVAPVSEEELTDDPVLQLPGFRIGKSGIEKTRDLELRGTAGNSRVEVNAYGRVIRELARRDGEIGRDVRLTIDAKLQHFAIERFGAESGACVVMDIHGGEVLALVSNPAFEPNAFNIGLSRDQWQNLVRNPRAPLVNKAIGGQYPPGSTFKMVVAQAALETGAIGFDHKVFCPGHMDLGDRRFHCWKRGGHGKMSLNSAIMQSCDVFFFDIAKRTGVDQIAAMAHRFGFGEALGLEIGGEKAGLIPTKDWKLALTGVPWQKGETLNTGIGQGYVSATPLQMCVMAARLGSGGRAVTPRLIMKSDSTTDAGSEIGAQSGFASLGMSEPALRAIREAMHAVSNTPRGTAYRSRITDTEFALAGKTGTSQVRRISKADRLSGRYKNKNKPWEERDHAIFVAYAPSHAPRYAISVIVEHGSSGSKAAAPVARDVLLYAQRRNPLATTPNDDVAVPTTEPAGG